MSSGYNVAAGLPRAVIWGASGHASVVADIVRLEGKYELLGFIDDLSPDRADAEFLGYSVFGGVEALEAFSGETRVIPGFGNCKGRRKLTYRMKRMGIKLAKAIHPSAVVARDCVLGAGTVVVAGAVINPGVRVHESVIVNTSASVDHDSEIGAASHICPGVRIAGNVKIGEGSWIGIGATVLDGVSIGAEAVIGAGAVVNRSIPDGAVAYGVPARIKE